MFDEKTREQLKKQLHIRENEFTAVLKVLFPEELGDREKLIKLITDLDKDEIMLLTNLIVLARTQRVSKMFRDFSEAWVKEYLEMKISHNRKGREEAISILPESRDKKKQKTELGLVDRVRMRFFKTPE